MKPPVPHHPPPVPQPALLVHLSSGLALNLKDMVYLPVIQGPTLQLSFSECYSAGDPAGNAGIYHIDFSKIYFVFSSYLLCATDLLAEPKQTVSHPTAQDLIHSPAGGTGTF